MAFYRDSETRIRQLHEELERLNPAIDRAILDELLKKQLELLKFFTPKDAALK